MGVAKYRLAVQQSSPTAIKLSTNHIVVALHVANKIANPDTLTLVGYGKNIAKGEGGVEDQTSGASLGDGATAPS
jgi:hypothetical protein